MIIFDILYILFGTVYLFSQAVFLVSDSRDRWRKVNDISFIVTIFTAILFGIYALFVYLPVSIAYGGNL